MNRTLLRFLILTMIVPSIAWAHVAEPEPVLTGEWIDDDTVELRVIGVPGQPTPSIALRETARGVRVVDRGEDWVRFDVLDSVEATTLPLEIKGATGATWREVPIQKQVYRSIPREKAGLQIVEAPAGLHRAVRNIRIHGTFGFVGPDGFRELADTIRIEVVDEDGVADAVLFNGTTDTRGAFDFTFSWDDGDPFDPQPDLRIRFYAENEFAPILYNDLFNQVYSWEFDLGSDFTGVEARLDPRIEEDAEAVHLASVMAKAGRWFQLQGFLPSRVDVKWPSDDRISNYKSSPITGIQMTERSGFSPLTMIHEYGHHWVHEFGDSPSPSYCNGICDNGGCGHCAWCPETVNTAWTEGFPTFFSWVIADHIKATSNFTLWQRFDPTQHFPCTVSIPPNSESRIEGMMTMLAYDMVDTTQDNKPTFTSDFADESSLRPAELMYVAANARPTTIQDFVEGMAQFLRDVPSLYPPGEIERLWKTSMNGGFDFDAAPPSPPTDFFSGTHTVGVETPMNVISVSWSGESDDASGVSGYSILLNRDAPSPPTMFAPNHPDENSWLTDFVVEPGTWWFSIRSWDHAGNVSPDFASYGPFVIGDPVPGDLAPTTPEFWTGPIVLATNGTGTPSTPTVIPPDVPVFLHWAFDNPTQGAVDAPQFWVRAQRNRGPVDWAQSLGPDLVVPSERFLGVADMNDALSGRHSYHFQFDYTYEVDEAEEMNNRIVRQYVIGPKSFEPPNDETRLRARSTVGMGLAGDFDPIGPLYRAGTGARVRSDGFWNAYVLYSEDLYDERPLDSDLYLYGNLSTGHTNGFTVSSEQSVEPAGEIDSIFVNANQTGNREWDVLANFSDLRVLDEEPAYLHHVRSIEIATEADVVVPIGAYPGLELVEFFAGGVGDHVVRVQIDPSDRPFQIGVLPAATTLANFDDVLGRAETDSNGVALVSFPVIEIGYHCLVIWDRPDFGAVNPPTVLPRAAGDVLATVYVGTQGLPDLRPDDLASGWAYPLVPRPLADATSTTAPAPEYLVGDAADTWFNVAGRNAGLNFGPSVETWVTVDGSIEITPTVGGFAAGGRATVGNLGPFVVPAGRHTLGMRLDPLDVVGELQEFDNTFAWQWGWQGSTLVADATIDRPAPPYPTSGHDWIDVQLVPGPADVSDGPRPVTSVPMIYPNSDGVRLPAPTIVGDDGHWSAVASLPYLGGDHQLRLHEATGDPETAFAEHLAVSSFAGVAGLELVAVNHRKSSPRAYDVGVVGDLEIDDPTPYSIQATASIGLEVASSGPTTLGPFQLAEGRLLALYEIWLDPGSTEIDLTGLDGRVDLGLSVMRPLDARGEAHHARQDFSGRSPSAWAEPAGSTDGITIDVDYGEAGFHAIAVWRVDRDPVLGLTKENFVLTVDVVPAPAPFIAVDGIAEETYGEALVVQTLPTLFGDSQAGELDHADGSELDQLFARIEDETLYLTLAGNLASNFDRLELFFDSTVGGQNPLRGDNADVAGDGLNRMGDDGSGNGLRFDTGFDPDFYFTFTGGDDPYRFYAFRAELLSGGGGVGTFLGKTTAGPGGALVGGEDSRGVLATIDNTNRAGVDAGQSESTGEGVRTGVEVALPLGEIGSPDGCVRLLAFVNRGSSEFVSNQFLPPLPDGSSNLGEPREVDLTDVAGTQWVDVCPDVVVSVGDSPSSTAEGLRLDGARPNPFNPQTEIRFAIPQRTAVDLSIYDVAGRRVRRLVDGDVLAPGPHAVAWDGTDEARRGVASGVYLVRLHADGHQRTTRVVLLK